MKSTGQKRPAKKSQPELVRPTSAQLMRQAGLILIVVVIWSLLLVGYLSLTGPGEAPVSGSPAPTEAATPAETAAVSFSADVLPILSERCQRCHGSSQAFRGIDLSSYQSVMAGSSSGAIVVPGNSATSQLVEVIVSGRMPQGGPRLSDTEIETITAWVDQGALDN